MEKLIKKTKIKD
ncbi:Protein of unknown function [Leuconostoc citreum LBAE C11]|nr:Protein of unknown function [Leuconostoc citreum LBAE C11]